VEVVQTNNQSEKVMHQKPPNTTLNKKIKINVNNTSKLKNAINKALDLTHLSVAQLFKTRFPLKYFWTDAQWVHFNKDRQKWDVEDCNSSLSNDMIQVIIPLIVKEYRQCCNQLEKLDMKTQTDELETMIARRNQIEKLQHCLGNRPFRNQVLNDCQDLYRNPKILDQLDKNPFLLGFEGGCIDLKIGQFRDCLEIDYISQSIGWKCHEIPDNDPILDEAKEMFFNQMFNDPTEVETFITILSTFLLGENPDRNFIIFVGKTRAGKSATFNLLRNIMGGEYCGAIAIASLQGKKFNVNANGHTSNLASLKKVRIAIASELDKDSDFDVATIKRITGGDLQPIRGCHEKKEQMLVATYKVIAGTNVIPKSDDDDAFFDRIIVVPFLMQFLQNPNPQKPNEKQSKELMPADIERLKNAALNILIKSLVKFFQNGKKITMPQSFLDAKGSYKATIKKYDSFIDENLMMNPGSLKNYIQLNDVWDRYIKSDDYDPEKDRKDGLRDAIIKKGYEWKDKTQYARKCFIYAKLTEITSDDGDYNKI
jgi:phage/plasmid-associated DNA primase